MRTVESVLLLAVLVACSPARSSVAVMQAEIVVDPYAQCVGSEAAACFQAAEERLIAASTSRVMRSGDTLFVRVGSPHPDTLVDNLAEGDPFVIYRYGGIVSTIPAHIVDIGYYEGTGLLLIRDDGGARTSLLGYPVLSPDGKRVASASTDLEANYNPNGIWVHHVTDTGFVLEQELDGGVSWGASDILWADSETLLFSKNTPGATPGEHISTRMRLRFHQNGIEVEEDRDSASLQGRQ